MLIYRLPIFFVAFFLLIACDFSEKNEAQLLKTTQCDANLPCTFPSGVKVWLSNSTLSPETPFTIFSELPNGLHITDAKLKGVTMYMGYIPQQFIKKGELWQSNTMVGICSEKNMLWRLELTILNQTSLVEQILNYNFYVTY
ncbi:hypothetical protein [Pseudoalteromonas fuliginea]|uniref:Lipoprotein n=1 Tax=Pseudoalteromonas fuliginea TaxID=1872678 RepID=A0ABQ6RFX8_9GAMM|nr:hypothetical protein [Pseudoalteromonas fuliginea]KAA1152937.1 hypothetical protein EU509_14500 [Pseudoalteromonas fuliginea]KAA1166541.1 hypothetical protein EUZ79_14490 [Pseudoalteromonas fuliginea]